MKKNVVVRNASEYSLVSGLAGADRAGNFTNPKWHSMCTICIGCGPLGPNLNLLKKNHHSVCDVLHHQKIQNC